jgi:transposase
MRRIADLHPGTAKTGARDAFVIADAARSMPHTLRDVRPDDETAAELSLILGFDEDLAAEATRASNRIRALLATIHPSLERVLGPRLAHPAALALLRRHGSPAAIRAAGRDQVAALLREHAPRLAERLADEIFTALDEQSVTVPGTDAAALILPGLTASLAATLHQRAQLAERIEALLEAHPLAKVLTSMPGVGVRTGAHILVEIGDASAFPDAAHLASFAGLAPVTRRSGTSIHSEAPSRRGNKALKRAFFLAAFAALKNPVSRAYYDRKITQGKRHNQALLALARRRCDVLYAMIKNGTLYQPPTTSHA